MSTLPNLDATLAVLAEYEAINHRCLTLTADEGAVLDELLQRRQVLLHQMTDFDIPTMRKQLQVAQDTRLEDQIAQINSMEAQVDAHLMELLEELRTQLRSNQTHTRAINSYQSHNPMVSMWGDDEHDDEESSSD